MRNAADISFGGETLVANADHILWWPRRRTLFVADLHAGKTEHMRRYGVAIPPGSLEADLRRLDRAIDTYKPAKVIFLGDLFHSDMNDEWQVFAEWCRSQRSAVELIKGNHDRFLTREDIRAAGMTAHDEPYHMEPFALRHHPTDHSDMPSLVGHIHPVVNLYGPAKEKWRLPCFVINNNQLVLPSFGSFTGGQPISLHDSQAVYACAPDFDSIFVVKSSV